MQPSMKKYIIAFIAIVAIFGGIAIASKYKKSGVSTVTPISSTEGSYCSSEGKLTNTKPVQSHRSYCIKPTSDTSKLKPNTPATYSYSIIDDRGETLHDFDTVHEKTMHLIVVRKDLNNFQHVHPAFQHTGEFSLTDLNFPSDGQYRIFADFTPTSSQMGAGGEKLPVTLSQDVNVGDLSKYKPQPIGQVDEIKNFNGYDVQMSVDPQSPNAGSTTMVSFGIKQNGKPVTNLQNYLGALGHSVVLSENDLEFIHAHPLTTSNSTQTGKVDFHVTFPKAGTYKLFTQFQHDGKVFTTDFVLPVSNGSDAKLEEMEEMMEGMDH
jgi:hypothetical protein